MDDLIYFDYNATTPIDPRVLDAMLPYLKGKYGNAASSHNFGGSINKTVQEAREKTADLIGADYNDIVFSSGATESINLALKGYALANQEKGRHIITVETEHKAVIDTCKYLESVGFEVTYLPVESDGLIKLENLENELRSDTILVSVMLANNETGVLQSIKEIANLVHKVGAFFMTDATQAVGKISVNVDELGVDMMTFSAHKFYGTKGAGALYFRELNKNRTKIIPLQHGGGHENGLRSGTLNVPAIVGLGKACEIVKSEMNDDALSISKLRDELERELLQMPGAFVNGSLERRMYNVSNICFPGMDANLMIGRMKNVAVSNGSACTSAIIQPSYVLKALGLSDDDAMASIRFSLGKFNTIEDVQDFCKIFFGLSTKSILKQV